MSFREVKELRKAGKLEEAYEMALFEYEDNPEDIWNKRSLAWVLYDYLKANAELQHFEQFVNYLNELVELQLPEDEKMVFDKVAWQIGKMNFAILKENHPDIQKTNQLFAMVKQLHFTIPSEGYSFILKAFIKGHKEWPGFLEFADWWNFDNFRPEDFKKEAMPNGKTVMALVERAHIAYAKKLLVVENELPFGESTGVDKEKIQAFIPRLDKLIEDHPEYQYPSYFKAKLLLALGGKDDVLAAFIPFAKSKKNDFWVWDLMADVFVGEDERKMACLCKALSLRTPEDFLINTRAKLAGLLINKALYNEAKTEILQIIRTRERHDWKIPAHILQWQEEEWFAKATDLGNNKAFYQQHLIAAEAILFGDVEEEVVVVEYVNKNKRILNFVKNKEKRGFFKYDQYLQNPAIGNLLKVRFDGERKAGRYKVLSCKMAEESATSPAIKDFSGKTVIGEGKSFGFVDNIFLSPDIINQYNIRDGQSITGKAMLSYNKKKEAWGWKVIELN